MPKAKNHPAVRGTNSGKVNASLPRTRGRVKKEEVDEEVCDSDAETSASISVTKDPKSITKIKFRNNNSAPGILTNSSTISIDNSAPQPAQNAKRKGGNKRKWTHEYCLTCTRYGRACGGRREDEEGCAVCRDPDKSKGEKLRECLWADPEAGINDYRTAREVFKRTQAELRARKAKSATERKRQSEASSKTGQLPRTSKPLDLLPPVKKKPAGRSSYNTSVYDHNDENTTGIRLEGATCEDLPRIHRPELTYVNLDSDEERQLTSLFPNSPRALVSPQIPRLLTTQTIIHPAAHYATIGNYNYSRSSEKLSHDTLRLQVAPFGSAYGPLPGMVLPPVSQGTSNRRSNAPPTTQRSSAQAPASPQSSPLSQSASPPRKWSREGSDITSIGGYKWQPKAWKPADNEEENADNLNQLRDNHGSMKGGNDTSSLSSYMSIEEGLNGDSRSIKPIELFRTGSGNKHAESTGRNEIIGASAITFPGEIIIQEDENSGTDDSDSELTSDEGKLKSLPSKLRKVLSRSRITKVIIGNEVFEIRPKSMVAPAKVQKSLPSAIGSVRAGTAVKGRKQVRKRTNGVQSPVRGNDTKAEHQNYGTDGASMEDNEHASKPTPLKIKLIFNRKTTTDSSKTFDPKEKSEPLERAEVGVSTNSEDIAMDGT